MMEDKRTNASNVRDKPGNEKARRESSASESQDLSVSLAVSCGRDNSMPVPEKLMTAENEIMDYVKQQEKEQSRMTTALAATKLVEKVEEFEVSKEVQRQSQIEKDEEEKMRVARRGLLPRSLQSQHVESDDHEKGTTPQVCVGRPRPQPQPQPRHTHQDKRQPEVKVQDEYLKRRVSVGEEQPRYNPRKSATKAIQNYLEESETSESFSQQQQQQQQQEIASACLSSLSPLPLDSQNNLSRNSREALNMLEDVSQLQPGAYAGAPGGILERTERLRYSLVGLQMDTDSPQMTRSVQSLENTGNTRPSPQSPDMLLPRPDVENPPTERLAEAQPVNEEEEKPATEAQLYYMDSWRERKLRRIKEQR